MSHNPYQPPREDEPQTEDPSRARERATQWREWLRFLVGVVACTIGGLVLTYLAIAFATAFERRDNFFQKMER